MAMYRRVIASDPDHADAHFNLGVLLPDQAELDNVLTQYSRSLELQPGRFDTVTCVPSESQS